MAFSRAKPAASGRPPSSARSRNFAGTFVPTGWASANGQLLSIADNKPPFEVIGTTYGGDGVTNFALPDLRGRIAIGADAANPIGSEKGVESVTVTQSECPAPTNSR
jgi:microcystin-dependent protein